MICRTENIEPETGGIIGRDTYRFPASESIPAGLVRQTGHRSFLKDYLITMRPYLMFVSGITGVAGMSFAPFVSDLDALAIFVASFLSYGFGQALTDCFQIDTDSISSPYRPLTQGRMSRPLTIAGSLAGLTACMTLFAIHQPWNILLGALAASGLALYTPFKKRWWGGPAYNSWIVALLFCIAFYATGTTYPVSAPIAFVGTIVLVFFAYANFVLTGYFKDISADRATGYNTLPVVFGIGVSTVVSDLIAVIMCGSVLFTVKNSTILLPGSITALLMITAGMIVCMISQIRLHQTRDEHHAHRAIVPVVHCYLLFLGGIAALQRPGWSFAILIFYAAFVIVLNNRPERSQI